MPETHFLFTMRRFFLPLVALLATLLYTGCETTSEPGTEDFTAEQGLVFLQHRLLPGYLFTSDEFLSDLRAEPLKTVQKLWFAGDGRKSADEIDVEMEPYGQDGIIYYYSFPPPTEPSLCYAIAMVVPEDPEATRYYFTLELASGRKRGIPAFFGGWTAEGEKLDYGVVANTDFINFKRLVRDVLKEEARKTPDATAD